MDKSIHKDEDCTYISAGFEKICLPTAADFYHNVTILKKTNFWIIFSFFNSNITLQMKLQWAEETITTSLLSGPITSVSISMEFSQPKSQGYL